MSYACLLALLGLSVRRFKLRWERGGEDGKCGWSNAEKMVIPVNSQSRSLGMGKKVCRAWLLACSARVRTSRYRYIPTIQ